MKRTRILLPSIIATLLLLALPVSHADDSNKIPDENAKRDDMVALGLRHKTAENLFTALKQLAKGGTPITYKTMPDWSGVWTTDLFPALNFDHTQKPGEPPTAKQTPEYKKRLDEKLAGIANGIEYDPQGECKPPGVPRWLQEPFLREFVVTPKQTWLINEVFNEIRRVYTDGREHLHPLDRFPTFDGDSIGFWDGDKLVIHTNQLREGQYQRAQPFHSDQIELVEIWQLSEPNKMTVHAWAYDPPALLEPWYGKKEYFKVDNADKSLRIHYWHCFDNQNNDVYQTDDGTTQFKDFDFTNDDNK
jgi:hypothetical protein